MTDALTLAMHLRGASDESLGHLLDARAVADDLRIGDFFDLAEVLLDASRVAAAIQRLDRPTLLALSAAADIGHEHSPDEFVSHLEALAEGEDAVIDANDRLGAAASIGLIGAGERVVPYLAVSEAIAALRADGFPSTSELASHPTSLLGAVSDNPDSAVNALAAERAFTTTTAIGELIAELTTQPARELGRGGLALPDSRRLSSAAGLEPERVSVHLALAERARLVTLDSKSWRTTEAGVEWLTGRTVDRWETLVTAWRAAIPADILDVLARRARTLWGENLRQYVQWYFPAGGEWILDRIDRITEQAELLGVIAHGTLGTAGRLLIQGETRDAVAHIIGDLPHEVTQVYLQHDLTVIAPGPLTPDRDARLRLIADLESRSQASSYRLSPSSIDRGLSAGETRDSITAFLAALSLTGIPQPVEYLISDTAVRHGRLRVGPIEEGSPEAQNALSYIRSDDGGIIDTLTVDQALTPLGLHRNGANRLVSRFARDVVFWAMQDARYPVAAETADGELLNLTRHSVAPTPAPSASVDYSSMITRMRDASNAQPGEPDEAWLARQLEAAVKRRDIVIVTVAMPGGGTVDLELEPTGVGGGRLRGRDQRADVERTLPLASIVSVKTP